MNKEELLNPRFKVLADYPLCRYDVGDILDGSEWYDNDVEWVEFYSQYPHLFKRLEWWEERKVGDMPQYVKLPPNYEYDNPIQEVVKWELDKNGWAFQFKQNTWMEYMGECEPITAQEYNDYTTSKNHSQ